MNKTYRIVRHFQRADLPSLTVKRGLSFEEAKEHCHNPDTSSATCTSMRAIDRTLKFGEWFDGWEEEE